MSYEPFDGREIKNPTPELMREELDKYFVHVQQHDPKSLKFALMVAGHEKADGSTHVCSMIGGSPQTIAHIIAELMDELVERDPTFAVFFILSFLQRMRDQDFDNTGGADVEAKVKDLLGKLQSDGSVH